MKPKPARKDESHSFSVNVAIAIGDRKALLLKELYGWCLKNWHNNKNIKDGLPWTYNSSAAFAKKFPYWSEKSISRWLRELEADGLIKSANYNKMRIDKTKWYTVNFAAYDYIVDNKKTNKKQCSEWVKAFENHISHNEQCSDHNEQDKDHNEQDKDHNEQPIPSLTISYPSLERERAHENSENLKQPNGTQETPTPDSALPPSPVDDAPDWIEVAKQMAAYYKGEGKAQWEFMCAGIANPPEPIEVTRQWAGKHSDAPYMLRNWKRQTGKLTNWIKNEAKNNNKLKNGNAIETEYKAPANVRRAKRHNA